MQDEDATLAAADPATAADEALSRAAEARLLQEAVALLPPGQRQAVELLALQERSLEEASGDTGRTKVALKVNLHRAIHALRRQLANGADAGTTDV